MQKVTGTVLKRSDIDIAVSGVRDFGELEEVVEWISTLYTIDLLDLDSLDEAHHRDMGDSCGERIPHLILPAALIFAKIRFILSIYLP